MNMKALYSILALGYFLLNPICNYRVKAQSSNKPFSGYFVNYAKTSDKLYITDSISYLMDKTPLEAFPDYKDLYKSYDHANDMVSISVLFGTMIKPKASSVYHVTWFLKDNLLYMGRINFIALDVNETKEVFPNNEQYRLMEKMTKIKFDRKIKSPIKGLQNLSLGAMPAKWVTGRFIVKEAFRFGGSYTEWDKIPCKELVFKNGRLIATHILHGTY